MNNNTNPPFVQPPSPIIGHYAHTATAALPGKGLPRCSRCGEPTGKCLEDALRGDRGAILCDSCFDQGAILCDSCFDQCEHPKAAPASPTSPAGQPCYLVLSVRDLHAMLARTEDYFDARGRCDDRNCVVFRSTVRPDGAGQLQIASYDIAKGPSL